MRRAVVRGDRRHGGDRGFVLRRRRLRRDACRAVRGLRRLRRQFSSLERLAVTSTARGETRPRAEPQPDGREPRRAAGSRPRLPRTVPVYVHVVSPDGVIGNVSDRIIRDQIRVLNATFGGFEGGYATGFSFTLAGTTRTVNADWFYAEPRQRRAGDEARPPPGRGQRAQHVPDDGRRRTSAGPICRTSSGTGTRTWTASSSTGSRCKAPRPRTRAGTTRARRRRTRPGTGSTSSTRSSAAATRTATTSTTRRPS